MCDMRRKDLECQEDHGKNPPGPVSNVANPGSVRSAGQMPVTTPTHKNWLNVPGKIRDVVSYHLAPEWHGHPLYLMIPGGVAAVTAGVWIFFLVKAVWVDHLRSVDAATPQLLALLVPYFVGLAIFSYVLVHSHLRPAAVEAGVIARDWEGRFGFHNFRHSLASYLVRSNTDPKTVQALLRHSDVKTTLQLYSHSVSQDRLLAQGVVLQAILGSKMDESGLNAD